jgi:CHAT domain-containing protein
LADLVKQLSVARSQLAKLSMGMPKPGQEAAYRQQLDALAGQEQELSRRLGQATGRTAPIDPWVEPAAVRAALAKNALLIEIARFRVMNFQAKGKEDHWFAPHYAAWLIPAAGQGEITIVDLGEAKPIDLAVQAARKMLEQSEKTIHDESEARAERQVRKAMQALTRLVFTPLERHFGKAKRLLISPDSALWLIPWGALPLEGGKYAIEEYQISYLISGSDLIRQTSGKKQKLYTSTLFANPDYDLGLPEAEAATRAVLRSDAPQEQVASSRGLASLSSLPKVGRLPGTAEEAEAIMPSIERYAGVKPVLYQDQFALEGVFKALHRPRVLVLSGRPRTTSTFQGNVI